LTTLPHTRGLRRNGFVSWLRHGASSGCGCSSSPRDM